MGIISWSVKQGVRQIRQNVDDKINRQAGKQTSSQVVK